MKQHCLKGIFYLFHSRTKLISPVIYLQFSRWVTWLIIALVEIKKEKEWVQEKAKQNCGRWSAGGRWQRGWWRGNDHHLRREIEKLKVKNRNLKKEVEEINAERVLLRTERNERADKYSKLKKKKNATAVKWSCWSNGSATIYDPNDAGQLEAIQVEPLYREYEGMNYYLLYNQTFIVVHGSVVVQGFRLMSIWFSIVSRYIFLYVFVLQDY